MANLFGKMRDLILGEEYDDDDYDYEDDFEDLRPSEREPSSRESYSQRSSYGQRDSYAQRDGYSQKDSGRDNYFGQKEFPEYAPISSKKRGVNTVAPSQMTNGSQIVSIHTNVQMEVVIMKPECYEDAQAISDRIRTQKPVVVNLEKLEYPLAQRIMDFLSGTCYSLDGTIQRVANNIFIIAPENVDISGDFKEELKTKGVIFPWVNSSK